MKPYSRLVLSAAVLVLAVVAAWWSTRSEPSGSARPAGDGAAAPDAAAGTLEAQAIDAPGLQGRSAPEERIDPAAPAGPGGRVLEIHVVDREDRPLPGQVVVLTRGTPASREEVARGRTQEDGVARFSGVAPDDVTAVAVLDDAPVLDGSADGASWWIPPSPVTGWTTRLRSRAGMPLRVVCFDASTGAEVPGVHWGTGLLVDGRVALPAGRIIRARPGARLLGGFHVVPPAGYVAYEARSTRVSIAPTARTLLVHYPLHPEAHVALTLRREDGKPIGERIRGRMLVEPGFPFPLDVERLAADRIRLRGVPFVPRLACSFSVQVDDVGAVWEGHLPAQRQDELLATLTLSEEGGWLPTDAPFEGPANNHAIGIGGGDGPAVRPPEPERGTLTVFCRLADGSPARGVRVVATGPTWRAQGSDGRTVEGRHDLSGRTDGDGHVTFDGAPVGRWSLHFRAWHAASGTAEVRRGERTEIVVREPRGGDLEVTVVDQHDKPIPFARVGLLAGGDTNVFRPLPDEEGVQRADAYTDAEGRRTLRRIAAGMHEITVRWHERSLVVHVKIEEGKTARRTLILDR